MTSRRVLQIVAAFEEPGGRQCTATTLGAPAAGRTAARRGELRAERLCAPHAQLHARCRRLSAHAGFVQQGLVLSLTGATRHTSQNASRHRSAAIARYENCQRTGAANAPRTCRTITRLRAVALASITRLRVRSIRYLPEFLLRALASVRQARGSPGCLHADVRREANLIFWTRTVWHDEEAMRAFMKEGAHRIVMPKIFNWCDEASVVHWQQGGDGAPDWFMAEMKMRDEGRISRVRNPSPAHQRGETVPPHA